MIFDPTEALTYSIGYTAQILFSGRMIFQWIASEKKKQVVTQQFFWEMSLFASVLLFIYGYLRHDFSIMLGQIITYYIYIRNIQLQKGWAKWPSIIRVFLYFFPLLMFLYGYNNKIYDLDNIFRNEKIPLWLIIWGSAGQIIFTLRFVYQWLYSEKKKQSSLPLGFWLLSITGSLMVLTYSIIRKDPVLFVGHSVGVIAYSRNLYILLNSKKNV